jgi:hypothetical protein
VKITSNKNHRRLLPFRVLGPPTTVEYPASNGAFVLIQSTLASKFRHISVAIHPAFSAFPGVPVANQPTSSVARLGARIVSTRLGARVLATRLRTRIFATGFRTITSTARLRSVVFAGVQLGPIIFLKAL